MRRRLALLVAPLLALSTCASIGPATVQRDRFDYNSAVADSWKQQQLPNIVRLRYGDNVVFIDVAQIVSGYTFQGTLTGTLGRNAPFGGYDSGSLSAQGTYIDRPTITYASLTGQQFMRALVTPVAPWARAVRLVREAQRTGDVGMRIDVDRTNRATTLLSFRRRVGNAPPKPAATELAELAELLGLDPGADEYVVTCGMRAGGGRGIDMNTRSLLQILGEFASTVEIPQVHVEDGSAYPPAPDLASERPLMRIRSGPSQPEDPFTAVRYGKFWYWIDRNDLESKRTFSFLIGVFNFTDTGKAEALPLVTIPAQ